MTTATPPTPFGNLRLVGALTAVVAIGLPVAAILTAGARDVEVAPGAIDWIFVGGVAAFTAGTFALLVPWCLRGGSRRQARSAISLSVTAVVLTSVAFWTMVPLALGVAGSYLGTVVRSQRRATGEPHRVPTTAIVLGALAALGSVAAYIATS